MNVVCHDLLHQVKVFAVQQLEQHVLPKYQEYHSFLRKYRPS
eukprot:XP_001704737.1 Hypothetical protein GL50803_34457 [Giardia lamblia ATCC 50803]